MPANLHKPEDVDAYMDRLDQGRYPDRRMTYVTSMADVEAKRPALQALVRQWVDLVDRAG